MDQAQVDVDPVVGRVVVGGRSATDGLGDRGLAGLPRIDVIAGVGRPDTSRLVYEILRDPRVGEPMPPDDALSPEEVRAIADWILGGARTD